MHALFRPFFGAAVFGLTAFSAQAQNDGLFLIGNSDKGSATIYKVSRAGAVSTVATGLGLSSGGGLAIDSNGNLYATFVEPTAKILKITPDGMATPYSTAVSYPSNLAVDAHDNMVVNDPFTLFQVSPAGALYPLFPGQDLFIPAFDAHGVLYVINDRDGEISRVAISPVAKQSTLSGVVPGHPRRSDWVGELRELLPPPANDLGRPEALVVGPDGDLYVSGGGDDWHSGMIFVISTEGKVRKLGNYPFNITSLAFDAAGNLFALGVGQVCVVAKNGALQPLADVPNVGHTMALAKGFRLDPGVKFLPAIQPMPDQPVSLLRRFGALVFFVVLVGGGLALFLRYAFRRNRGTAQMQPR